MARSFLFGGDTGETAESLKRQRQVADALLAQASSAPQNVGEGLNAIGNAILYRATAGRLQRGEAANASASQGRIAALLGGINGGSVPPYTTGAAGAGLTTGGTEAAGLPSDMTGNDIYSSFMGEVGKSVTNPYGLAAIAATGKHESGFSPGNAFRQWSDPSESGQAGNAGGILSWRAERLNALRQFASANGGDPNRVSPELQARYFLQEDPSLVSALNAAKSPEEAQQLMNNAWRFAGYNRAGGEAGRRIATARSFASQFGDAAAAPTQVASLDPSVGMPNPAPAPQTAQQRVAQAMPAQSGPVEMAGGFQQSAPRGINPAILESLTNPNATEQERSIAGILLQQQMEASDPMRQMQAEKARLELDALRNPQPKYDWMQAPDGSLIRTDSGGNFDVMRAGAPKPRELINGGDGRLYDPNTQQWIIAPNSGEKLPDSVRALQERASLAGLKPGTPEYNQFMISGGSGGTSLSVGPDGSVQFSQGGAGKPLTEGQSKDTVYSTRARGALGILDKNANTLTSRGNRALELVPFGLGRGNQDTAFQLARQAGDEFLQAILRKDTGAAITEQEQALYGVTYLPQPGDSKDLLKQKQQSRARAVAAIEAGLPPSAIVQQEIALRNSADPSVTVGPVTGDEASPPEGVSSEDWEFMTPEEKALFR